MVRVVGSLAVFLLVAWVVAHLLFLGPIRDVTEVTLAWAISLTAGSALVASLTVLAFGLLQGRHGPAWLRFVQSARTAATVVGCAVVIVGLLHYRDTEPRGEVLWIVLGLAVLAGAGVVHWWIARTRRSAL